MRTRHRHLAAVLAAAFALVLAAPAGAATPRDYFGVMLDGPALADDVDLTRETSLIEDAGAGSVRVAFYWRQMQPEFGPIDFSETDRVVAAATARGLRILPTVVRAPAWATGGDDSEGAVPRKPAYYAGFIGEVVRRYGPGGSFWAANPALPVLPIRSWQVWNEPDIGRYWQGDPWPRTYVSLLRQAYKAIKAADPGAQVVAAGLTNRSWKDLGRLYRAGARRWFDAAAIHPFSRRPANVMKIVRLGRRTMRRHGDAAKPLLLTEVSWSSGKGRSTFNYGWEVSEKGQARKIRQILPRLARARTRQGIQAVYWYTWLSPPVGDDESFSYAGLRRMKDGEPVDKPALRAFRRTVRRLS